MTEQGAVTGPPIAMDRPAGQPADLPKEGNTRVVELPQGMPRHDKPREQKVPPARIVPPAPPETSGSPAPAARSIAPTPKVTAGVAGSSIAGNLAIVITYYAEMPWEVALSGSVVLIALAGGLAAWLQPSP